ncbi:hypothetical protein TRFO_10631 [Tritrichomonas foetus]|uniref:Uncharacterized protein n=1 Tax=Tritrichomonas foetus TaxID=1144522 RepID=A0A1J4J7P2_9EUKA|nr:hypothetical protein TRFO_10631 [Tritrichomonas foetus]|eukprot:OHS95152.1 hypothetical protein TRFO_10631 [Tritrichomonas foetus]
MELAKWNLDNEGIPSIRIMQIKFSSTDENEKNQDIQENRMRLLVLSHQINFHGSPCFFFNKSPGYVTGNSNRAVVIVFDFFSTFNNFELPPWAERLDFLINPSIQTLHREFFDHLQRSFVLYYYYKYRKEKPLYFDTFLMFPHTKYFSDPFVFRPIPVFRNGKIHIRIITAGNLEMLIDPPIPLATSSCLLVEPYSHPFFVEKIDENEKIAFIRNVDHQYIEKHMDSDFHYVLLTNPPVNLSKLSPTSNEKDIYGRSKVALSNYSKRQQGRQSSLNTPSPYFNFETTEFYTFDDQSFDSFFANLQEKQTQEPENKFKSIFDSETSYFEYPETTLLSIINEEISDKKTRKVLTKVFTKFPDFPMNVADLILPNSSFISFFQFDISLCKAEPPIYTRIFSTFSDVNIQHLGLPNVKINANGNVREINPISIFTDWKKNHYSPISGSKSAQFVVFIVDYDDKNVVMDYFESLQCSFTWHELGNLTPYPKCDPFFKTTSSKFFETTNQFFKHQPLSEFRQYPILSFVVCPQNFEHIMTSHSICTYLTISQIKAHKQKDIDHVAFTVYSRMRLFHPFPFGMIDIAPPEAASLFFGYRYQPPFVLSRIVSSSPLTLHIAWDPITGFTAWVDDIGSVSHIFKGKPLQELCQLMVDIVSFLKDIEVDITFTILSESPSEDLVNNIISLFSRSLSSFSLFSIIPAPQIQIISQSEIIDDILIFDDVEVIAPSDQIVATPKCTCYVVAPDQPAYRISNFYNSKGETPKRFLQDFARNMSHLSWLAEDSQTKKRVLSFPPHIVALLRKIRAKTKFITGFDFLPQ